MNPVYRNASLNNNNSMLSKFINFYKNFRGDPNQKLQDMLNSGQVTNQQVEQAKQMANQYSYLLSMIK